MTDDLDLMQLASSGQTLARLDHVEYLAVNVVLAWPANGAPAIYCAYRDWAATPIARLAAKEQEIVELAALAERNAAEVVRLAAEVANLKAQLDALSIEAPPAPESGKIPCDYPGCLDWIKPRGMAAHKRQAHGISILGTTSSGLDNAPAQNERRKCPHCTARPKLVGLAEHIAREHPYEHSIVAVPSPSVMEMASDLGWRCAEPHCAGAFTRSLSDPDHCTQHAVRVAHTNGHEIAA